LIVQFGYAFLKRSNAERSSGIGVIRLGNTSYGNSRCAKVVWPQMKKGGLQKNAAPFKNARY